MPIPYIAILWIMGSLIAALMGRNRWIGFWGTLLFALFLSPIVAIAALILTHPKSTAKAKAKAEAK